MTIEHRRLARASLESPMDDGGDRNVMPMQTLIGVDSEPPNGMWLLETTWDGGSIGDVQVWRNLNANADGSMDPNVKADWVWWGGVPRGRVKSYRFARDMVPRAPATLEEPMPFNLPHGKREAEPRKAREGGAGSGAGA